MEAITISVPGNPVAKGRHRFSNHGGFVKAYTPAKTRKYEELVARAARRVMGSLPPLTCPVRVDVVAFLPVPKSWSKLKTSMALAGEVLPTGRPDKDNFEKAAVDALNGIVYADDSQITDGGTRKRYSEKPGLHIIVVPIAAYCANQNPNKERPHYDPAPEQPTLGY